MNKEATSLGVEDFSQRCRQDVDASVPSDGNSRESNAEAEWLHWTDNGAEETRYNTDACHGSSDSDYDRGRRGIAGCGCESCVHANATECVARRPTTPVPIFCGLFSPTYSCKETGSCFFSVVPC